MRKGLFSAGSALRNGDACSAMKAGAFAMTASALTATQACFIKTAAADISPDQFKLDVDSLTALHWPWDDERMTPACRLRRSKTSVIQTTLVCNKSPAGMSIAEVRVSTSLAPPSAEFSRFGRISASAGSIYFWLRRAPPSSLFGPESIVVVDICVLGASDPVPVGFALVLDEGAAMAANGIRLAVTHVGVADASPMIDLKLVAGSEAAGEGFEKLARSLTPQDAAPYFLAIKRADSKRNYAVGATIDCIDSVGASIRHMASASGGVCFDSSSRTWSRRQMVCWTNRSNRDDSGLCSF